MITHILFNRSTPTSDTVEFIEDTDDLGAVLHARMEWDGVPGVAKVIPVRVEIDGSTFHYGPASDSGNENCIWHYIFHTGAWDSGCGHTFLFVDAAGPMEEGFEVCPFCGKKILEVRSED